MQRLGVVENIAYDGLLLVRARFAPPPGAKVLDGRSRALGRVKRVFGPVAEPYVAVEPLKPPTPALMGTEVYIERGKGGHAQAKG